MSKLDLDSLFPAPKKGSRNPVKRTYDVNVTTNHSGKGKKDVIRFGFINYAASVFGSYSFIEASDVEYMKNRIYFRVHDHKANKNVHTLSSNDQSGFYFAITPSEKAEKIYRMNWVAHTYALKHDGENDLFYIENTKEANK